MGEIVTGYTVKYTCSNCEQHLKDVSIADFGVSFFRVGDPNVYCENCGVYQQIDTIREYKDLSRYEKILFNLGFWCYIDVQAYYYSLINEYNTYKNLISRIFFLLWGIPLFIFLMVIKNFLVLAMNPYFWLPIGMFINYKKRSRSLMRTNT